MSIEIYFNGLEIREMNMSKTIKISDSAHKALEFVKIYKGEQIGKYASIAIVEAIQKDHPDAYEALKKFIIFEEKEE
jgi:hypothetical protein